MREYVCEECGQEIEPCSTLPGLWAHVDPGPGHLAYPSKPKPAREWSPEGIARLATAAMNRCDSTCDVCGGSGKPVSGKPCVCGGTGDCAAERVGLRTELYRDEAEFRAIREERDRLAALVEKIAAACAQRNCFEHDVLACAEEACMDADAAYVARATRDLIAAHEKEQPNV